MTLFDYHLNPLYPIKECSSCGALYTTDYCCSVGILRDKIFCDLDKTPDLSQRSTQNCPKCGNPVPIIPDLEPFNNQTIKELPPTVQSSDPKFDLVHNSPNVFSPSLQPPIYSYEFCGNDAYYGQDCSLQFPVIHQPPQEMSIQEIENSKQQYLDEMKRLINSEYHDEIKIDELKGNFNSMSIEINKKEKLQQLEQVANLSTYPLKHFNSFCYDDDDNEDYAIAVTPSLLIEEPDNSLSMRDEHLDTIPATESDEFINFSVENLVPILSESEGESEYDVPVCEAFITFSNILFDAENDFYSSDNQSFSDEDVPKKIYSNPLFDEEIIPMKIDPHHFNAKSDLIESLLNNDSSIIPYSKIDSLFDEFAGELTLLKSIPPGIDETDCYPKEETHFIKRLLYDKSSPRPLEEFVSTNSKTEIESFSPSPIPVEDSDSLMKEIDLSFTLDYPMPPGIEDDDYDSERDILILKDLLSNDALSLPEIESFYFDIPSFSRRPTKPPDGNIGILNVKMMGDISEQKVPIPKPMITLASNQEKSPDILSHQGLRAF
uniref:Reverse transcriptase domain-containing protein n=1 Tax=Tanacetum cinerariifolium TaxID=118510 RepID=A0A699I220_TANCI|nr:hypothetical protein [Tanacetum cinerariifolium]